MTRENHEQEPSGSSYSRETIEALVEGRLDWPSLKAMMSAFKDPDRFDKYVGVLQERVPWKEKIVLPVHEHLYIVARKGELLVKAACGYEYGDSHENWKMKALIYVREREEQFRELYPGVTPELRVPDPRWIHLREYYCPGCGSLLEVEYAVPGYPVVHNFCPDVEAFYEKWLGRPVPKG